LPEEFSMIKSPGFSRPSFSAFSMMLKNNTLPFYPIFNFS